MAILERNFAAHFAVRVEGIVHPLCKAWRTSWNWTLERGFVTCPQCKLALELQGSGATPAG